MYDSLTEQGKNIYQNQVDENNKFFYENSDYFYINYLWSNKSL